MNRYAIVSLCFCALSFLTGTAAVATESAVNQLDRLELSLFGSVQTERALQRRIENLETQIWGQTRSGGLQSRLAELNRVVEPSSSIDTMRRVQSFIPQNQSSSTNSLKSRESKPANPDPNPPALIGETSKTGKESEPKLSAAEFNDQEISAIIADAKDAKLSPSDQQAIEQAQKKQRTQALKRRTTAAACVLAIKVGRKAAMDAIKGNGWHW